ncbi:GntR family transcriptional regulator [Paracoccus ravus]|uniref:GntR family transcriptional regulator n=1 Tax=Paracoccus ravus TaxID=2447760 RepID=UPI00106E43B7|nr:GntR family transcriptional regulator [Paracoccus ravus]
MSRDHATLTPLEPQAFAGLREHVHRALRQVILSGEYAPGARLNERAIAEQLGVSTTPVKEALRLLEADGLVCSKPRSGVIVNFDMAWAEEMILARAAIESTIARLAAQRVSTADTPVLEAILVEMRRATSESSAEDLMRLNEVFHRQIRSLARANYLGRLNDRQDLYDSDARRVIHSDPAERARALAEHDAIGRAVIAGDAEAAEAAMKAHVLRAGETYLDLVFRNKEGPSS